MKINKIFMSAFLGACALGASAQGTQEVTETVFHPHWYIQAQAGAQWTLGENAFGRLISPNIQLGVGNQFTPAFGARLTLNGWQSRGALDYTEVNRWKWDYIAPSVDFTVDLTNLVGGFDADRKWGVGVFAGVGVNFAWHNDEALAINNKFKPEFDGGNVLRDIWDGTKVRFVGRLGANFDYQVSEKVKIGLELNANVLGDKYNSKRAHNADWYFNALLGVKYCFGGTSMQRTRTIELPPCEPQIIEKVVEKVVEKIVEVPAPAPAEVKKEEFRRDIFFTISNSRIDKKEQSKVQEIIAYMKANPATKVVITGYADKGTGSLAYNLRLSKQRAQTVLNALVKGGISRDRIVTKSMGEEAYQPYDTPAMNRVAICVAED